MSNWLQQSYNDLTLKALPTEFDDDFKFMKKQMMLRFKSRRYAMGQADLAMLNLLFAFNWVKEFAPIEEN